jgi:hypothetical protein
MSSAYAAFATPDFLTLSTVRVLGINGTENRAKATRVLQNNPLSSGP